MRTPTENGFGSMWTPRRCSISKVSRALCPSASTTWSAADLLAAREHHAADAACGTHRRRGCGVRLVAAACLPGLDAYVGDALPETDLAAQRFDLGAHLLDHADEPERADVRLADEQDLFRRAGLDELGEHLAREVARVADLAPQLAVGEGAGPPSPNCTFDSGSSTPWRHRAQVSLVRSRTARPRSSTIGRSPICARIKAANRPQGPKPTTSGRGRPPAWKSAGAWPMKR